MMHCAAVRRSGKGRAGRRAPPLGLGSSHPLKLDRFRLQLARNLVDPTRNSFRRGLACDRMAQVDCAPPESGYMAYQDRVFASQFLTFKNPPAEAGISFDMHD